MGFRVFLDSFNDIWIKNTLLAKLTWLCSWGKNIENIFIMLKIKDSLHNHTKLRKL